MLYFSYGIRKSGSTLAFELTKGLLEALGHPQERLDIPCFADRKVHFLNQKQTETFDEKMAAQIQDALKPGRILVIKTHGRPSPYLMKMLRDGSILGQANIRDPRDNTLSLVDAGKRARKRGRGAFMNIDSVESAMAKVKDQMSIYQSWVSQPGILACTYDEVAFDSEAFLEGVGTQLGYDQSDLPDLIRLANRVKKSAFTQFNKGVPKRHRSDLNVQQTLYLTHFFRKELTAFLNGHLDSLDQAILQALDTEDLNPGETLLFDNLNERIPALPAPETTKPAASEHLPHRGFFRRIWEGFRAVLQGGLRRFRTALWHVYSFAWLIRFFPKTKKTFVVLGCPRGGTSLIAGSLQRAGVYMGEVKTNQYEDPDFKIRPRNKHQALQRLGPVIRQRNRTYAYWGWKVPNNIYYIEKIKHVLIRPVYIFVYRDPEAIARSSARHDGKDWAAHSERLLEVAHNHTKMVRQFQAKVVGEAYEFRVEDIHTDPEAFADRIMQIVQPIDSDRRTIIQFINPKGGYV